MNDPQDVKSAEQLVKMASKVEAELDEVFAETEAKISNVQDRYESDFSTEQPVTLQTVFDNETGELFQFDLHGAERWDDPESRHPFFRLYRLPNGRWILCWDKRDGGNLETRFEEWPAEGATAWLLRRGFSLPEELKGIGEAKRLDKTKEGEQLAKLSEAIFGLPPVIKYGPVCDDYSGDKSTLFQYPYNRWILHTSPSYAAAGQRHAVLSQAEAVIWFLNNGLEVPKDLYEFLPPPPNQQTPQTMPAEYSEQVDGYQEPPNGQKYGPVMDEWGNPTTLTYYSPRHWILFGSHRYHDAVCIGDPYNWRKAITPGEATDWLLDNGFTVPPILTPYLPLPSEGGEPPAETPEVDQDRPKVEKVEKECLAVSLLMQHPDWTDTQIASEVGVARTTLYDWPKFKTAKAALKSGRKEFPKGCKDSEGNIEAFG